MLNIGSMCTGARVLAVSPWQPGSQAGGSCGCRGPQVPACRAVPCMATLRAPPCSPPHQSTPARVPLCVQVKHDLAKLQLTSPVCTKEGEKIALSRRVDKHWRLIGWGQIQKGLKMEL